MKIYGMLHCLSVCSYLIRKMMYIEKIFKSVHFERSCNVSKLAKILLLIVAMSPNQYIFIGRLVKCIKVNTGVLKNRQSACKSSEIFLLLKTGCNT